MCISMHNLTTFSVYKKLFSSTVAKSHEDHDIFDSRQCNHAVPTNCNASKASFTLSEPHASKADHHGNKCISSHSFPKSVDTHNAVTTHRVNDDDCSNSDDCSPSYLQVLLSPPSKAMTFLILEYPLRDNTLKASFFNTI